MTLQILLHTGAQREAQGGNHDLCAELLGGSRSPNNVPSTFFNTVHLLLKYLRFERGGAKLIFCPGLHLTSLRPWVKLCIILFDAISGPRYDLLILIVFLVHLSS